MHRTIFVFDKTSKFLQSYDPRKKRWKRIQALNGDMVKYSATAVVLHPHLYVMLGNKAVYRFDFTSLDHGTATWERMADKSLGLGSAAVLNGFIYVTGWYFDSGSVEKYDPANNEWVKVVNTNQQCAGATLVSARGNLYCIGGQDSNLTSFREVQKFNPATSSWSYVRPMNQARSAAAAVEFEDKIYVMGGRNIEELDSVECYDIDLDSWTILASMKVPRNYFSACVVGRKIFVVGGYGRSPETMEKLDLARNEWKVVERMEEMSIASSASVAVSFDR